MLVGCSQITKGVFLLRSINVGVFSYQEFIQSEELYIDHVYFLVGTSHSEAVILFLRLHKEAQKGLVVRSCA